MCPSSSSSLRPCLKDFLTAFATLVPLSLASRSILALCTSAAVMMLAWSIFSKKVVRYFIPSRASLFIISSTGVSFFSSTPAARFVREGLRIPDAGVDLPDSLFLCSIPVRLTLLLFLLVMDALRSAGLGLPLSATLAIVFSNAVTVCIMLWMDAPTLFTCDSASSRISFCTRILFLMRYSAISITSSGRPSAVLFRPSAAWRSFSFIAFSSSAISLCFSTRSSCLAWTKDELSLNADSFAIRSLNDATRPSGLISSTTPDSFFSAASSLFSSSATFLPSISPNKPRARLPLMPFIPLAPPFCLYSISMASARILASCCLKLAFRFASAASSALLAMRYDFFWLIWSAHWSLRFLRLILACSIMASACSLSCSALYSTEVLAAISESSAS
mmetsp:Transcript_3673/g.16391  ORF Transcript_3673/g.16391 Transcript_3673/m.16391 type:complete len:390 (-) Transcript_3673:1507-2676(-)